jgi:hypothetical protein
MKTNLYFYLSLFFLAINVHAGDIDASLSFTIWVYDMWINDLVKNGADPYYIKQVKSLFDLFKQRRCMYFDIKLFL